MSDIYLVSIKLTLVVLTKASDIVVLVSNILLRAINFGSILIVLVILLIFFKYLILLKSCILKYSLSRNLTIPNLIIVLLSIPVSNNALLIYHIRLYVSCKTKLSFTCLYGVITTFKCDATKTSCPTMFLIKRSANLVDSLSVIISV